MHSKYPLLEGREDMLRGLIEQRYDQLWERHKYRLSDGRSETHLQVKSPLSSHMQTANCSRQQPLSG